MDTPDPNDKPPPTYMSPKLREKLYEGQGKGRDSSHEQAPTWMGPAVLALLAVAVVVVVLGVMQSNADRRHERVKSLLTYAVLGSVVIACTGLFIFAVGH